MGNHISPFLFEGEHLLRAMDRDDDLWFAASDVAKILGYATSKDMTRTLDEDEKGRHIVPTLGGDQELLIVSEPGLYRAITQRRASKKHGPELLERVARFQRWVFHDVLPSIRKTGTYSIRDDAAPEAPLPERRPFPDWPLDEFRMKSATARDYRSAYGVIGMQWIMPRLGYPVPPPECIERGRQMSMTFVFPDRGAA